MFRITKSPVKNKKKRATFKIKGKVHTVDFGHTAYEDYTMHGDDKRRVAYLKRSAGIRDGRGKLTKNNPLSGVYWSRRILWASGESFAGIDK